MREITVLEELYHSNIKPVEKSYDKSSTYAKFAKIIAENEVKLTEFLTAMPNAKGEQHLLSQMINAQSEVMNFLEFERFVEGFQLGASLIMETCVIPQTSVLRDIS